MLFGNSGIAMAIASALALTGAATPGVAAPLPTALTPQVVKLKQLKHADVDGDHHTDTVRVYDAGKKGDNTLWKVKVTTAAGKVSSVTFPIPTYQTDKPWYGWAVLDGQRGAELLFETHTDDGLGLEVLTWRGGTLRREASPVSPSNLTQEWGGWFAASEATASSGYRFGTTSGHRYVDAWDSDCPDTKSTTLCTVKAVRSVWRAGSWHKSAVLPTTKVAAKAIFKRAPLGALKVHR
jgi:hypothetical protein